jgi:hypothetical protein
MTGHETPRCCAPPEYNPWPRPGSQMRLKSGNARDSFGPGTRIGPEFRDMRQIGISASSRARVPGRPELALGLLAARGPAGRGATEVCKPGPGLGLRTVNAYIRPTVSPSAATTQKSPGRVSPAITQGRKRSGASGMPLDSADWRRWEAGRDRASVSAAALSMRARQPCSCRSDGGTIGGGGSNGTNVVAFM